MSIINYRKKIIVPFGAVQKIAKEIGCSDQSVRNALRFITSGDQPDKIRKEAIENYGGEIYSISKKR